MARTEAALGVGARLIDPISPKLLARDYPCALKQGILCEHGVESKRLRSVPMLTMSCYRINLSRCSEKVTVSHRVRSQYCSLKHRSLKHRSPPAFAGAGSE